MKHIKQIMSEKWKWHSIAIIGGILLGAGVADCILAVNKQDINQIARGLTIFSAGITILVVMDNAKTQRKNENYQKDTHVQLEVLLNKLNELEHELQQTKQHNQRQLDEIKQLLKQNQNNSHLKC